MDYNLHTTITADTRNKPVEEKSRSRSRVGLGVSTGNQMIATPNHIFKSKLNASSTKDSALHHDHSGGFQSSLNIS